MGGVRGVRGEAAVRNEQNEVREGVATGIQRRWRKRACLLSLATCLRIAAKKKEKFDNFSIFTENEAKC